MEIEQSKNERDENEQSKNEQDENERDEIINHDSEQELKGVRYT